MAFMQISIKLLIDLLELPEGTDLTGDTTGNLVIEVSHPSIPEDAPWVTPVWRREEEGEKPTFLYFDYDGRID